MQEDVQRITQNYPPDFKFGIPVDSENMTKFMIYHPEIYMHPRSLPVNFDRWLEVSSKFLLHTHTHTHIYKVHHLALSRQNYEIKTLVCISEQLLSKT